MNKPHLWWQTGIIYQIYPRSYQDSNDDGIGDLNGIWQRLDYIQSPGVKTIWLSPIFPSPMHDFGYAVADYVGIHPMFGSMADFDTLLDNMRFWLGKGVDGFRVDVIWLMLKDEQLRDEPPNPDWDGVDPHGSLQHIYTQNVPGIHDLVRQMRTVLDEYDERMMVGEIYLPYDELMMYYGRSLNECHLPFNFHLINCAWKAEEIRNLVETYEAALPAVIQPEIADVIGRAPSQYRHRHQYAANRSR